MVNSPYGVALTTPNGVYWFPMKLRDYLAQMPVSERKEFAIRCRTSLRHLQNVAYGKTCGESLAINVERESDGAVRCEELRSDVDWAYLRGTVDGTQPRKPPKPAAAKRAAA